MKVELRFTRRKLTEEQQARAHAEKVALRAGDDRRERISRGKLFMHDFAVYCPYIR